MTSRRIAGTGTTRIGKKILGTSTRRWWWRHAQESSINEVCAAGPEWGCWRLGVKRGWCDWAGPEVLQKRLHEKCKLSYIIAYYLIILHMLFNFVQYLHYRICTIIIVHLGIWERHAHNGSILVQPWIYTVFSLPRVKGPRVTWLRGTVRATSSHTALPLIL